MPIYTYQCDNCGVRFERQQSFSDQPLTRCPECQKKTLRKIYTPVGILFKGAGFYATDHRSPSGTSRSNGSSKAESENKGSESSESTPAKESSSESTTRKESSTKE